MTITHAKQTYDESVAVHADNELQLGHFPELTDEETKRPSAQILTCLYTLKKFELKIVFSHYFSKV